MLKPNFSIIHFLALLVISLMSHSIFAEDLDLRSGKKATTEPSGLESLMGANQGELKVSEEEMRSLIGQIYAGKTYKGKKINQLNQAEMKEFLMDQLKNSGELVDQKIKALDAIVEE